MLLSTILTQKYSIIQIVYSAALIVILYVLYIQNEQIKLLMQKNTEILERLTNKEKELEALMNKIFYYTYYTRRYFINSAKQ
jgi:hypothetical protein